MKKKHLYSAMLVTSLALLSACSKPHEAVPTFEQTAIVTPEPNETLTPTLEPTATSTPSPEPTATSTPSLEPTATSTPSPEPTATSTPSPEPTATSTPSPEPTATSTPKPTATATPKPTATPTAIPTLKPTATATPKPTAIPTAIPTLKPTEIATPTPVPTNKPTPSPEPTPTEKPSTSDSNKNEAGYGTGKDIVLENIGITIPTLKEFNDFSLTDGADFGWISTDIEGEDALGKTFEDIREKLIDDGVIGTTQQAFLYNNYKIGFSSTFSGATDDIELYRDPQEGIYTLVINVDLREDELFGVDFAPYNRDITKVMLSIVTPNVEEVFEYLWTGMYEDSTVFYANSYHPVGDCQIKVDKSVGVKDGHITHIKFYIKGN